MARLGAGRGRITKVGVVWAHLSCWGVWLAGSVWCWRRQQGEEFGELREEVDPGDGDWESRGGREAREKMRDPDRCQMGSDSRRDRACV